MEEEIDLNGCRIWSTSEGEGPPVIFLNGGFGCDDYLGDVAAMISGQYQVVRFEPRGCGRSDWDGHYDLETTLADIDAIRQHFGFERTALLGHSAGVGLSVWYAMRQPERVSGLIGLSGGYFVNDRDWHAAYDEGRSGEANASPYTYRADPEVNRKGSMDWKAFIKRPQLLSDIAQIHCPAVFIAGANDIRPNWPIQQVAALMPRGQYREIAGASHYSWVTHPGEVQAALEEALEIIGSADTTPLQKGKGRLRDLHSS